MTVFAHARSVRLVLHACLLMAVVLSERACGGSTAGMSLLPAGNYRPLFRATNDPETQTVASFWLDRTPVTRGQFLDFVKACPKWRRSRVIRLFADTSYLSDWKADLDPGIDKDPQVLSRPAVQVSWFAARAYAEWRGCRLPTTPEWERAAAEGFLLAEGLKEPEFRIALAHWYGSAAPEVLPLVGSGRATLHGIHDLHGLIWEWTEDFNSSLVTGDSREDTGLERQLFCGAGSVGARERSDFPAFMRSGFRSSLRSPYTLSNLGFRCALSAKP